MRTFDEDRVFHTLMKENILQEPSSDFEDNVMSKIEREASQRSLRRAYVVAIFYGAMAAFVGITCSIFINEIMYAVEVVERSVVLFVQAVLVLAVLMLVDFVIVSYFKYVRRKKVKRKKARMIEEYVNTI